MRGLHTLSGGAARCAEAALMTFGRLALPPAESSTTHESATSTARVESTSTMLSITILPLLAGFAASSSMFSDGIGTGVLSPPRLPIALLTLPPPSLPLPSPSLPSPSPSLPSTSGGGAMLAPRRLMRLRWPFLIL